ncbi:MAG: hypothetical protein P4L22_01675 [Candidatus Babeliales bacterium]|nr:hypothetical protein [Candidatus Babeliales bacterium]
MVGCPNYACTNNQCVAGYNPSVEHGPAIVEPINPGFEEANELIEL